MFSSTCALVQGKDQGWFWVHRREVESEGEEEKRESTGVRARFSEVLLHKIERTQL